MPGLMGRSKIAAGGMSEPFEPALELRLLAGGLLFRNLQEFRQAMRHRYVLANCAGLCLPAIVLLYALDSTQMPIDLQVPAVVVGLVAANLLTLVFLSAAVWVSRRIGGPTRINRVWVTPGLVLGAAGMLAIAHVMHQAMQVEQDWTELQSRLLPFSCVLYLEVALTIVFRGPMPRALAQLRQGTGPLLPLASTIVMDGTSGAGTAVTFAQAGGERDQPGTLVRLGLRPADVLRLEASGNYVTVVTRTGRHLLPGPFSAVAAQMPAQFGRQVQRSHWVALAAVEGTRKTGRELWLRVVCGAWIPVSAALRTDVLGWLEAGGKADPGGQRVDPLAVSRKSRLDGASMPVYRQEKVP